MLNNLRRLLGGSLAQINPLDRGRTFGDVATLRNPLSRLGNHRRPRPAAQQTMTTGRLSQSPIPGLEPNDPLEIGIRGSGGSNILQGIDEWNGAPFRRNRPVEMPSFIFPRPIYPLPQKRGIYHPNIRYNPYRDSELLRGMVRLN